MVLAHARRAALAAAALLLLPLAACDGDAASSPAADTADAADALASDVQAEASALVVTAMITPDPPTTGQNALMLHVHDDTGAPVPGATITVDPQMPMHGHGSTETAVVTDDGDGVYTASPVTFQMPGAWKVTIDVTAGALSGQLVLDYTVQ